MVTPQIRLINIDRTVLDLLATDPEKFALRYRVNLGRNTELVVDIARQTRALMEKTSSAPQWGGYLAVDALNVTVVGTCAFKGKPSDDGCVEIAYFTFPEFEGRGYATRMAERLIAVASADPEVRKIVAHTLPQANASTRILEKVGMTRVGEVIEPVDGLVWRWELSPA